LDRFNIEKVNNMNNENVFNSVKDISIARMIKGYSVKIGNHDKLEYPDASNFEWRIAQGMSPSLYHMYFGNETGDKHEFNFHITFNEPCEVKVSNGHPRCYIHIGNAKG